MNTLKHNLLQLLISIDQVANCLIGLVCNSKIWADETISSRAYRLDKDGITKYPRLIIDTIFFFDTNHCEESYYSEVNRLHIAPELRN